MARSDSGSTFNFGGTSILYSEVAILIHIAIQSVQTLPFLCALSNVDQL